MQAIVSDIIVSQALQTGQLQVSQNLNNNSSNSLSFSDMLNSLRSEHNVSQSEQKPAVESDAQSRVENTDKTEKSELQPKDQKPVEQPDEKQTPETADQEQKVNKKDSEKSEKTLKTEEDSSDASKKNTVKKNNTALNQTGKAAEQNEKLLDEQKVKAVQNAENNFEETLNASELNEAEFETKNLEFIDNNSKELELNVENNEIDSELSQLASMYNQNRIQKEPVEKASDADLKNEIAVDSDKTKLNAENDPLSKIVVRDERTSAAKNQEQNQSQLIQNEKNTDKSDKSQLKANVQPVQVELNSDNSATITMELAQPEITDVAANTQTFQTMLSNQIEANAPDLVKAGTILLKDNDKGSINLVLHPDDLGNVKIHLSMDGKTISAHITVNTKEALEVFKDNAQTLREAFAKNGFDTSNFDVSYNGNSNGQNQSFEEMYDGSQFMARKVYNDFLSGGNEDGYIQDAYEFAVNSEYSINIVA